jgi:hypothetical protein
MTVRSEKYISAKLLLGGLVLGFLLFLQDLPNPAQAWLGKLLWWFAFISCLAGVALGAILWFTRDKRR